MTDRTGQFLELAGTDVPFSGTLDSGAHRGDCSTRVHGNARMRLCVGGRVPLRSPPSRRNAPRQHCRNLATSHCRRAANRNRPHAPARVLHAGRGGRQGTRGRPVALWQLSGRVCPSARASTGRTLQSSGGLCAGHRAALAAGCFPGCAGNGHGRTAQRPHSHSHCRANQGSRRDSGRLRSASGGVAAEQPSGG